MVAHIEANDRDTYEAEKFAKKLHSDGERFTGAVVSRFSGLTLLSRTKRVHFKTPLCGYSGTGPQTTATILELFGFGGRAEILKRISTGGDSASFRFGTS